MADNKTPPTNANVDDFIMSIDQSRHEDSYKLINLMKSITGHEPVMWGPSIIGFDKYHYKYETGREGDAPKLSFSPRKANITIYIADGFNNYLDLLAKLGKHKISVSCLYINNLSDVDLSILKELLQRSYKQIAANQKPELTIDGYIKSIPEQALPAFNELRQLAKEHAPNTEEVMSYGIIGYKMGKGRALFYISGWKDHVSVYPVPKNAELHKQLSPYIKGKGTLSFNLKKPLPKELISKIITAHIKEHNNS